MDSPDQSDMWPVRKMEELVHLQAARIQQGRDDSMLEVDWCTCKLRLLQRLAKLLEWKKQKVKLACSMVKLQKEHQEHRIEMT